MNDTFTRCISRLLLVLFFVFAGFTGFAQYTKSTLETGGYYCAMTKDNAGNLFVVRYNSTSLSYEVAKYTNGTGTPQVIYTGLVDASANNIYSWGLAVNSLGDVFVTNPNDAVGWSIIKLAAPAYTASVIHTGNYYSALAVDLSNNLLAMEYNSATNTYQLVRYPAGTEQSGGSVVWNGLPYPATQPVTFPTNIALDSQGNIYLTDFHENGGGRIVKLTAPTYAAGAQLAVNRSFSSLAVDANNIFYTSEADPSGNFRIVKYTDLTQTGTVLYTGLHGTTGAFFPWGIAAMPNGNIFANDGENGGEVVKLTPPNINVTSIVRADANPIPATTVTFTVTFSGAATNVTASAFSLTTTGLTGASITGVTGSGTTYNVTVNTGTGTTGTVRLDVNGTGITPVVANVPYTSGAVYNIDRIIPTGSIVINGGAAYTNNFMVTLTLTGNDASTPLQMSFSVDGGAYSAYEAFATTKSLALSAGDGLKTVSVRIRDAATNVAIYSDDITLDQTPPNTTITATPPSPSNSATATFTFNSNEPGSTFQASLDGGPYVATTSPQTYTGLADGNHIFNVRAIDQAGNVDPTPAPYMWDIDGTGPIVTGVSVPANGYYRAGDVLQFKVKYNEPAIVTTVAGTPYINIIIGLDAKQVPYVIGSGTDELTFSYTVQPGEMDANGITVNPLVQNNSGFIRDGLGNNASTTLQNVASTSGVLVNTSIPSVTLSTAATMPTNAPFTVTVTFSEAVTGFTVSDFNVLNTTVSNLTTSDNITYTVLMTPASDGTRTISLPANSVNNIGGNGNTTSNTITYNYDATAPAVASVAVPANKIYKAGETMMFAVNFSENILLNTTGGTPSLGLTIGATSVTAIHTGTSVNSLTFSYTVVNGDMDMDGIVINSLALNGATLRDAATNNANLALNGVAPTTGVLVNTAHPSVTITSAAPAIVNAPFNATITFSEAVSNFIAGDITVTNANITSFSTSDNIVYTVQVTPLTEGNVSLNVAADVAENIGTNGNTASNTVTRLYDVAPPAITAVDVPINGYYKAGDVMNFTVHFSENITINTGGGNPYLTLTIGSTQVNTTYTGTAGTDALNFSYTILDGQMDMDGIEVSNFTPNGSVIRDAANNTALANLNGVGNTTGVFVNTQHPSVVLSTSAAARINVPFTVTVTFSEAVTGLTSSDFSVTNGTAGTLTGSNATYTIVVTPTSDGTVSISLPADVTTNIGDNGNTSSNTISLTYDATAPAVASVAVPANGYYKAGTTLDFTVRFDEDVIINTTGGMPTLALTIGTTAVNATYTGTNGTDGLNFSYTVVGGDMDMDGIVVNSLVLNSSTIKDEATNNAVLTLNGIGNTTMVRVNTTHPTVTVTTAAPARTNAPFTATITFSEAVTGFTAGDVAITNGTPGTFSTSDNITYTLQVIPATEGTVSLNVPADAAVNIGDNGNTASNTISLIYDITGPTVITVDVPNAQYYKAGDVLNFNVHFDEAIILNTVGGTPYITLAIGSTIVNANYNAGTPTSLQFSYTVANGDEDMDGITVGTLNLNGATIQDAATNNANLILFNVPNTSGVRVNTTSPSVTLSSTANALINAPFTVTATFSEAVTALTESDFSVTNGTVSGLNSADNTTFTLTVTPVSDGAVSIQLPTNAVVNIGGNANTPSNTLNFTYDGTAPVVTAVTVPASGYYKQGDALNFTVDFSENIFLNLTGGTPYLNVTLGTTTVQAGFVSSLGNQLTFSYTVQPGDMDLDGITVGAMLNANGGIITDMATNNANLALNNIGNTSGVFVHTGSPSVQLSTAAAARVNAPFTVTAVFNEAVTGLAAGDFTIINGTGSNLQTTDNITYTLLVTPTADGTVTIQLSAGQADNVVSNSNAASNTLNVTYDATAPVIAAGQSFEILERSAVGTQVGQVTATDASGTLTNWTIASDDSNGAFSIDANGNIIVADQAKLNSKANSTVTLTITVSDGLNTSIAVPVTVMVKFVNQAPTLNAINDETVCPDAQEHTIQLTGASATEPGQTYGFTVITDKPNFDKLSVSATGVITYQLKASATGTAAVTVTIKDNGGTANGGIDTLRRTFNITVATLGQITITSDKGNTISKGDVVHLTATGGTIFRWDDADGIVSGQQEAVLEARPMENTTYHVTVSNDAGCTNTADFTVTVVPDFKVEATNLLTPNGDGKNDKWVIRNLDAYPDNEVQIFDRTGRLVYNRRNYSNDWDGTMNGSPLGEGTYYYVLKIQGGAKTAKGYITIIRDRN
jgi:gliding motility-associated-like protein